MLVNKFLRKFILIFVFALMSFSHVSEINAVAKKKSSKGKKTKKRGKKKSRKPGRKGKKKAGKGKGKRSPQKVSAPARAPEAPPVPKKEQPPAAAPVSAPPVPKKEGAPALPAEKKPFAIPEVKPTPSPKPAPAVPPEEKKPFVRPTIVHVIPEMPKVVEVQGEIIKPSWMRTTFDLPKIAPDWWKKGATIKRDDFIKNLIGMSEEEFRNKTSWNIDNPVSTDNSLIKNAPRGNAITAGKFEILTVGDLEKELEQNPPKRTTVPYFSVLVWDPLLPWESDIRYLQSLPEHKNAVFQIASTFFGPLEGGMAAEKSQLVDMLRAAAQGEEASIATAGATFYRKYLMKPRYLLEKLKDVFPMHGSFKGSKKGIYVDNVNKYQNNPKNFDLVSIGLHNDVMVTSGFGDFRDTRDGKQQLITDKNQTVSQVFTSALDLRHFAKEWDNLTDNRKESVEGAAQMLSGSSYSGTLLAAAYANKPRVFLTLMGCGAFRNNIEDIIPTIQHVALPLIEKYGLQVTLLYRPDSPTRKDVIYSRNVASDFSFLAGVFPSEMARNEALKSNLTQYLKLVYEYYDDYIGGKKDNSKEELIHNRALLINDILMKYQIEKAASRSAEGEEQEKLRQ